MLLRASAVLALAATLFTPRRAHADLGDLNLGVNTHVPSNDLLDMVVRLGTRWIRVDGNWNDLNPARGTFDYAEMDRVVDQANARGLRTFMTLAYTPPWVPRVSRTRSDTYPGNDEPAASTEWVAFVEDAVRHFRARGVTHFGLWNEANLDGFWESPAGVDAWIDKILVPGAAAVRRVCADCRTLGPELAHVGAYDTFLDRVLVRAASSIDILTHHIYNGWPETGTTIFSGDNFLQALESRRLPGITRAALREVLDARGFTREVWISETGYRASPAGDAAAETNQATYVRRALEEMLPRTWWTNTFFYEIMDCGVDAPTCPIDGFGISRPLRALTMGGARAFPRDYRLKPAFDAIRNFIAAHPEIGMRRMADGGGVADGGPRDAAIDVLPSDTGRADVVAIDAPDGSDTSAPMDAGPPTDTAPDEPTGADANPIDDTPASSDSTRAADTRGATDPGGCACTTTTRHHGVRAPAGAVLALGAAVGFVARRRRRSHRRGGARESAFRDV